MYSTTDIGNMCVIGLGLFLFVALLGARDAWPMVGALAVIVFVCGMLYKGGA